MRSLLLTGLLLTASCAQMYTQGEWEEREGAWNQSLEDLRKYQAELEAENRVLRDRAAQLEISVDRAAAMSARSATADIDQAYAELQAAMQQFASRAGGGDLEYLMGPDGPVIRIPDSVLFPSGSAQVSAEGAELLAELVRELLSGSLAANVAGYRVEGHTDNEPVKVQAKKYPRGNLELSLARALEVADFLRREGLPEQQISVMGYGEWRPVGDNSTPEGRKRNRRVEIAVLTSAAGG